MQIVSVGDFKSRFSEILKAVQAGQEIAIAYGRSRKIVAYLGPKSQKQKPLQRPLGFLGQTASFQLADDYKLTEESFLGE